MSVTRRGRWPCARRRAQRRARGERRCGHLCTPPPLSPATEAHAPLRPAHRAPPGPQTDGVEFVIKSPHTVFALHRSGHLIPARLTVRSQGDEFVAFFEEIPTSLAFVWVVGAAHGWRVAAACPKALAFLDTSASDIKAGAVAFGDYVPDPAAFLCVGEGGY